MDLFQVEYNYKYLIYVYKNIFEEFNLQINAKNVASKNSGSKTSAKVYLWHSVNGVISCLF